MIPLATTEQWGLAGFCPGPAIVAATVGGAKVILFIAAMLGGMLTNRLAGMIHARETESRSPTIARHD